MQLLDECSGNRSVGIRRIGRAGGVMGGVLFAASILLSSPVFAEAPLSLKDAYQSAVQYDAQLLGAEADKAIAKEEVAKARSAFLPNLRASTSKGRNRTESITPYSHNYGQYYSTLSNSLSLKQPLFNLGSVAMYKQAKAEVAKSESLLRSEHSSLIVRTAELFCNVLYSEENIEFTRAQTKAALEQLEQSKRKYRNGFGTITEISEAQASYDMSVADEANSIAILEYNRRELERVTGVYAETLYRLAPQKLLLTAPEPRNVEAWVTMARENNHKVNAARKEIEIASREVDKSRASRYPVVDLWAGKSYSMSEDNYTIGSTYNTYSFSVQASVPIYTGGYTSALIRQSKVRQIKANDELNLQERAVLSDVRKFYNGQLNSIAQVKAYEQAVRSNEVAVEGTRKGFLAGFRSNVDVLEAQKKLLESRRSLAKARYEYILDSLMLKEVAGTLTPEDIDEVSTFFVASRP